MKDKHVISYVRIAKTIESLSPCCRNQFGAVIFDHVDNVIVSTGYNGWLRGVETPFCGRGLECERNEEKVPSGTQIQLGCVHAEMNAILNAGRQGATTKGKSIIITGKPCLMCAKLIYQAGIIAVGFVNRYSDEGLTLLMEHGIPCYDLTEIYAQV